MEDNRLVSIHGSEQRDESLFGIAFVLGMAAYLALSRRSYFGLLFDGEAAAAGGAEAYYRLYILLSALFAILGMCFARKVESRFSRKNAPVLAAMLSAVAGSALIRIARSSTAFGDLTLIVGVTAFSAGTTAMAFGLGGALASRSFSTRKTGTLVASAFLVSALISLCSSLLSPAGSCAFVVLCPLAACGAWYSCASAPRDALSFEARAALRLATVDEAFIAAIFLICSVMLGCGFTESLAFAASPVYIGTHFVLLLVSVLLLGVFVVSPKSDAVFAALEVLGVLAFVVLFFFEALFDAEWVDRGADIVASSRLCFELLLWVALLDGVTKKRVSFVAPIAAFLLLRLFSESLVNLLMPQVKSSFGPEIAGTVYKAFLAAFFLLAISFLVYKVMEMCRRPSAAEAQKGSTGGFADSCARIAAEFDLSKRESEVLALIARGNSSRWIADSLCISVSTVQTHSKNIYRKLGIHSKQDLIEMVDAGKDDRRR